MNPKLNILVICSDTFRYDHLAHVGRQSVHTPNLDRFAAASARFEDYWLCSFPTVLNRIEVFSGRYTFPTVKWGPMPKRFPVLSEIFGRHGFTTALISDNPHIGTERFNLARGFQSHNDIRGQSHIRFMPESAPMIDLPPCPADKIDVAPDRLDRYRRNARWYRERGTNTTECVFREAMAWFDKPRDRFFLWVDAFDPHEPWDAPERFQKLYPRDDRGDTVFWPKSGPASRYSDADLANLRSLYKAEVTQIDHWIGKFLEFLRDKNVLDNTVVIFCSDHGFYLGEHSMVGKLKLGRLTTLYEELGHVPLIIRHPDGLGSGQTISGLCQPTDLSATLLDLAGIPATPWFQGTSLVPRLRGPTETRPFAIAGCHPRPGQPANHTVLTDEWFLVYSPFEGLGGSELYHRPSDPLQTNNVIAENFGMANQLADTLQAWFRDLRVPRARQRQLLHGKPLSLPGRAGQHFWNFYDRCLYRLRYANYATPPRARAAAPPSDVPPPPSAKEQPVAVG